jgi:hypothetical protein
MHLTRLPALIVLSCCLTGCINSNTLIKIKPDGSGTIEQTMLMNVAAVKGMMGGLDAKGQMKETTPFNEAEVKRQIERFGKGVRFLSSTPVKEGGFEGSKVIYAFDDINLVSVDQDPNIAGSSSGKLSAGAAKPSNPVKFNLTRQGGTSILTVNFEEAAAKEVPPAKPSAEPGKMDPAMLPMLKMMFQGFKVAIDLEVDGKIVKTNADYVNGSRITLMELDLAGLFEDEAKLRDLQSMIGPGASIASVRPLLKDVKGVKINHPVVTVEFR